MNNLANARSATSPDDHYFIDLFYLYICPPESQESDQTVDTEGKPRPAFGDAKILLSACNLIDI